MEPHVHTIRINVIDVTEKMRAISDHLLKHEYKQAQLRLAELSAMIDDAMEKGVLEDIENERKHKAGGKEV